MSKKSPVPVAILVRVSTSKQETHRQRHELEVYAKSKGYRIVATAELVISGDAPKRKRTDLTEILDLARTGQIKKVLVHEISRVARRNSVAHWFLEQLHDFGVSLYWHTQRIETLLPDGEENPAARSMFSFLAEAGRSEREALKKRIASGVAEARRRGIKLGRPKGTVLEAAAFLSKHRDIVKLLKSKQSIRNAAKISDKGISTVQRVKAALATGGKS